MRNNQPAARGGKIMAEWSKLDKEGKDPAIIELRGLEHIRRCPGMYIGSADARGLYYLVLELVNNSIEEFVAGSGHNVVIQLLADSGYTVSDDGRGFPADPNTEEGK